MNQPVEHLQWTGPELQRVGWWLITVASITLAALLFAGWLCS